MSSQKPGERRAFFVRLPVAQAEELDRAAFALEMKKQDLVTALVSQHVDTTTERGIERLRKLAADARPEGDRVVVMSDPAPIPVGRHSFLPAEPGEVLTLEGLAALLQVAPEAAEEMAVQGELPGRKVGSEWRFSRAAILRWLAGEPVGR